MFGIGPSGTKSGGFGVVAGDLTKFGKKQEIVEDILEKYSKLSSKYKNFNYFQGHAEGETVITSPPITLEILYPFFVKYCFTNLIINRSYCFHLILR